MCAGFGLECNFGPNPVTLSESGDGMSARRLLHIGIRAAILRCSGPSGGADASRRHAVGMDHRALVDAHGGIVHRSVLLAAGASPRALRTAVARGDLQRIRRSWLATRAAPPDLRAAASSTARLACVSAARHRGWWMPPGADDRLHLHVLPHAEAPRADAVVHWTSPIVPASRTTLIESIEDTLDHVAACADPETAVVLWESACRLEALTPAELARVRWRSASARGLCAEVSGLHDSGLETIFAVRMRPLGLALRFQVPVAGRRVDALIGERLVVQLDGFAFHSTSADRTRDVAHDRELVARGYTVLRFTYVEVLHRWPVVERAIGRAIAQGAHLAAR